MAIDKYGQIIRDTPRPIPIQTNDNIGISYSTDNTSSSLWDKFNYFIGTIGNWFAGNNEMITGVLMILLIISLALPFIGWLISLGWLWGIVAGLFLGGIVYYAIMIVAGIFVIISNLVLGVVRYIFYNGVTFLVTLSLFIGLAVFSYIGADQNNLSQTTETRAAMPETKSYRCTAWKLNVREHPNKISQVLGTIKKNDVIQVYDINSGFARIKFDEQDGYISIKYIERCE